VIVVKTKATQSLPLPNHPPDPETQLGEFIGKFNSAHQSLIRTVRKELRRLFPSAQEMAYDNYNFFVIGYSPTERPSDAFLSIVASANGVGICFIHGASFPDPDRILSGSGKQTRFIHLESAAKLRRPEVNELLLVAAARSRAPLPAQGRGKLVIRSVSQKQRPRQKKS
jgi:Domain of unknown function (DU1801)